MTDLIEQQRRHLILARSSRPESAGKARRSYLERRLNTLCHVVEVFVG
jgi:hypothetical protein